MTHGTQSQSAFSVRTRILDSTFIVEPSDIATESIKGKVVYVEFDKSAAIPVPTGSLDIDDLVAEFEKNEASRTAIEKGRNWVADTFYNAARTTLPALRLSKGLSQANIAKLIETSQAHYARIEAGTTDPTAKTIVRIAKALGISAAQAFNALPSVVAERGASKV